MLIRPLQRLAILGLGALSVWLIVFVVFRIADNRLPWVLALSATYGVGAYVILPRVVRMSRAIAGSNLAMKPAICRAGVRVPLLVLRVLMGIPPGDLSRPTGEQAHLYCGELRDTAGNSGLALPRPYRLYRRYRPTARSAEW